MISIIQIVFYLSAFLLLYVWLLFPLAIWAIAKIRFKQTGQTVVKNQPSLSILIACLDEESSIGLRIKNVFDCVYPKNKLQVVVISDGSTDDTVRIARSYNSAEQSVEVIANENRSGRATAHNAGVLRATGDILVFTDAGTRFDPDFLEQIAQPFSDPNVGFATGALSYTNEDSTAITQSAGAYWAFEQALRKWESQSKLNIFGSGACCAMRTALYLDIPPTGDVDFTSPIDVALQGKLCVHVPKAQAYDEMPENQESEIKARIRMTSKNFKGILERWGWTGIRTYPALSWVILSHKYGRWITPFLLAIVVASSAAIWLFKGGLFISIIIALQALFYSMGLLGYFRLPIPLCSTVYSFLVGNYGMMMGVIKVMQRDVQASYSPIRNKSR